MKDKKLIERRFAAHFATYNHHATVQEEICALLSDYVIQYINSSKTAVNRALEVGAGTGFLTMKMLPAFPLATWYLNDLVPKALPYLKDISLSSSVMPRYMFGDAENITLPHDLDLVVSASAVQWFDDIGSFISNLSMQQGGVVALSSFASQNFKEIAYATQSNGLVYAEEQQYIKWFEDSGYHVERVYSYIKEIYFESPLEVLRHLKYTGVNGIKSVQWNKRVLKEFSERYTASYSSNFCYKSGDRYDIDDSSDSDDSGDSIDTFNSTNRVNRVRLTYNPLIVIARKL